MARLAFKVLMADVVLLIACALAVQDLNWRTYYAGIPHAGTSGYYPSLSYSLLTLFFSMARGGTILTSPPTLDWVQILLLVLVALNTWYGYRHYIRVKPPMRDANSPESPPFT